MTENPEGMFDAYYYQVGCGRPYQRDEEWLKSFDAIAARIVEEFHPKTVLDAGCALGFLVEGLRKRGVEAFGVDISEYAIEHVDSSIRPYCWCGSIAEPFSQRYDLIVTIEVVEHMQKEEADKAIANFCAHTDQVLFCSGFQDFREVTHINLHPPEYWAEQFARYGFFRDVDFDGSFLTPWTVCFKKRQEPVQRIIMDYERQINHLLQENAAVRQVNLDQRTALANYEEASNIANRKIFGLEQSIRELEQASKQKIQALEQRNQELVDELIQLRLISAAQVEQVQERDQRIQELADELTQLRMVSAEQVEQVRERDQRIQELADELTQLRMVSAAQVEQNKEKDQKIQELADELTKIRIISAAQVDQIKEKDLKIQALAVQLEAVKSQLEGIQASKTYRLAARARSLLPPAKRS